VSNVIPGEPKFYAVVAEFKSEEALVMEQFLRTADHETAYARMRSLESDPRVVRVALVALTYASGNRALLEGK